MVKLVSSDSGDEVSVSREVLLLYPLFCGMDHMEEILIPDATLKELEMIAALPVNDTAGFVGFPSKFTYHKQLTNPLE